MLLSRNTKVIEALDYMKHTLSFHKRINTMDMVFIGAMLGGIFGASFVCIYFLDKIHKTLKKIEECLDKNDNDKHA